MPNNNLRNLSTFKKQVSFGQTSAKHKHNKSKSLQIGTILRKINNFDEAEKNEAITYLRECIGNDSKNSAEDVNGVNKCKRSSNARDRRRKAANVVNLNSELIKRKFNLKRQIHRKRPLNKTSIKPFVLKCRVCSATKPTKIKLLKHLETHVGTPVSCLKCKRTFNSNVAYEWHVTNLCHLKKKSANKTFKCHECSKVRNRVVFLHLSLLRFVFQEFRFKRHLECHVEGHKRNNCTYCDMVLTHRKQLVRHMFNVHSIKLETAVHKCQFCEKR